MRTLRSSSGQGSIEYVGLIALVAALIVISGAALAHASDISRRVSREWARALCLVRGGDCRRDQEPCVVGSDEHRSQWHVDVAVARLGDGDAVLVERLSDGTYRVTDTDEDLAGAQGGVGLDAGVHVKGVDLGLAAELRAGLMGVNRDGRSWTVPTRAAADDLIGRLREHSGIISRWGAKPLPPADEVYGESELQLSARATFGASAKVSSGDGRPGGPEEATDAKAGDAARSAAASVGVDLAEAHVGGELKGMTGWRTNRRTRHTTLYIRSSRSGEAGVGTAGDVLGGSGRVSAGGELYAVDFGPDGRPLDLSVVSAARYEGSSDLPALLSPVAGRLAVPGSGARQIQTTTHLDLTESGNLAAARDLLGSVTSRVPVPGRTISASAALRDRIASHGTVEARVLDQESSDSEISLHGRLEVAVGAGRSTGERSARLLAAASRGLDGQWLMRDDCRAAA